MILFWRRRRAACSAGKTRDTNQNGVSELSIPINFRCPISLDLMKDPLTLSTGITYDRENIEKWIESGNNTCPITNLQLANHEPIPNHAIREMIQNWCVENKSYGIERIPTPRIPVGSFEVLEILAGVDAARRRHDSGECLELVAKIKDLAAESERNRRRLVASGAGRALSETFEVFSERSTRSSVRMQHDRLLLGEILSALTLILPLDKEANSHLGSFPSLNSMVWLLKDGDLSGRRTAVLVMKEVIISSDENQVDSLIKIEGAMEALVNLVKEAICPKTTKASLSIIYSMISSMPSPQFVEMGLVSLLLETLVDSERRVSERALGVLDGLCSSDEGREKAYGNSLTVPVLVKKMLRVSELATWFSVSILWKLSKNERRDDQEREEGSVVVEALQVGAFQKLLLVLQVGCDEETKEKASELLRELNVFRERLECVDSMDFKNLKRPF